MAVPAFVHDFGWDPMKAKANRRKHGVSFEEGATVFLDPRALSVYDTEHSKREDRWVTLGLSSVGRLLVVCHTFEQVDEHRSRIRIISSRKAAAEERRQYGH